MPDDQDQTPHGDAIYRYEEPKGWEFGDHASHEVEIEAHVERFIGPIKTVFHEVISNRVHVDVFAVEPREERPFWTFVTCGMSARRMTLPQEVVGLAPDFAEVILSVPANWDFGSGKGSILGESPGDYPIQLLRYVAHFPHDYSTWLGAGHTIPNGNPPTPIAPGTSMCGCMLTPVLGADPAFNRLNANGDTEIGFYGVVPLYPEELDLKLNEGADKLYGLFDQYGVSELFNPSRPSVVTRKKPSILNSLFGKR